MMDFFTVFGAIMSLLNMVALYCIHTNLRKGRYR